MAIYKYIYSSAPVCLCSVLYSQLRLCVSSGHHLEFYPHLDNYSNKWTNIKTKEQIKTKSTWLKWSDWVSVLPSQFTFSLISALLVINDWVKKCMFVTVCFVFVRVLQGRGVWRVIMDSQDHRYETMTFIRYSYSRYICTHNT